MVSGWRAVEKGWGMLRWWRRSAVAWARGVVSRPSLMVSRYVWNSGIDASAYSQYTKGEWGRMGEYLEDRVHEAEVSGVDQAGDF